MTKGEELVQRYKLLYGEKLVTQIFKDMTKGEKCDRGRDMTKGEDQ